MDKLYKKFKFPGKKPDVKEKLEGWLGEGNQLLLSKYLNYETKIVIEFGSWYGLSADFIIRHTPEKCILICVDTWAGDTSIGYVKDKEETYNTFLVNMWKHKDRVIPIRMDGREAMKYLYDLKIKPDLIYLDMDHSYESAKGDLRLLMKYFPDVLILGDDILYWEGVAIAVKEIMKEYKIKNVEINKNSYALIPNKLRRKYKLKELIMKKIKPKVQYLDHSVAIIVGYKKDKYDQVILKKFINYMTKFMKKTKLKFKIFVINQLDSDLNLGALYNIGFELSDEKKFDKFIFHDINLLPKKNMRPYYKRDTKYPIQLGYHWDKNYAIYYLGTMMFNKHNYKMINGYPNNIMGWEGWDHEVILRLKDTKMTLKIPDKGDLINNGKTRMNIAEWRKIKNNDIINKHSETWKKNGLSNIFYEISRIDMVSKYCCVYSVNILKPDYYLNIKKPEPLEVPDIGHDIDFKLDLEITNKDEPLKNDNLAKDTKILDKYLSKISINSIAINSNLIQLLNPYSLLLSSFGYSTDWINKKKDITINKQLQNIYDLYKYDLYTYISNNFKYINDNKLNYLHINRLPIRSIKKNIIYTKEESKLYINNLKHYLKNKIKRNFKINYNIIYHTAFFNNKDLVLNHNKYKFDNNLDNYNQLTTYDDYLKLVKQCNNKKFDLLKFGPCLIENRLNNHVNNNEVLLQIFYNLVILLKFQKNKGSGIIMFRLSNSKILVDFIYILKKYFKKVILFDSKIHHVGGHISWISCNNFLGILNSDLEKYEIILKKYYNNKLYNNLINNNNIFTIKSLISHHNINIFYNKIINYITENYIFKIEFYKKVENLKKLSKKKLKKYKKKMLQNKKKLYFDYLKINNF